MWWWSRISTISACSTPTTRLRLLGVVDEDHLARLGVDEVGAGDEADRAAVGVDHDGGAVVDVLDRVGDVGDEVVGRDRDRLAVHQRQARRRQRDHPRGDVAVERRDDDGDAALAREREVVVGHRGGVRRDEEADADLERDPLCVGPVADDDHVAGLEAHRQRARGHREHPDAAADERLRVADELVALEHAGDRADGGRRVEPRRLARLAHVAPGERALGDRTGEPAVAVDHRDQVDVVARHDQADLAHRVVVGGAREALAHHVARPQQDVGEQLRLARAAAVEHPARLRVELAEPDRDVFVARIEPAPELRVADRRRDRVGVGVAVAGDVDARHAAHHRGLRRESPR